MRGSYLHLSLSLNRSCFCGWPANVLDKFFLTNSMKGSITRLIFKKRGGRKDLKNWRPISSLNVDYKSIPKATTFRLLGVLKHIVHQTKLALFPVDVFF